MSIKRLAFVFALVALLLATSAAGVQQSPAQQGERETQAKALLAQRYGISADNLQLTGRVAKVRYPMLGITIHEFKFLDAQNGDGYGIALNDAGQEVNIGELDAAEKAAYETRFGKLDRELMLALRNMPSGAMVEVDIWLKTPENMQGPTVEKPVINGGVSEEAPANLSAAERKALKQQLTTDKTTTPFDSQAWDSVETSIMEVETQRVGTVTAPIAQELRAMGFKPVANASAPLINVTLPVRIVREYAKRAEVDTIYMGATLGQEMNVARQVVGANYVNSWGFTGTGSRVAVVEYGGMIPSNNPYLSGTTRDNYYSCATDGHVTSIAGIIRSTHSTYKGVAPGTTLWVGCGNNDSQIQTMTNRANSWNFDTISLSWYSGSNHSPGALDKFYDKIMFTNLDLVVKSAGNRGDSDGWVTPPGLGYNTLTVGNFDDKNTVSTTDDVMRYTSSYVDPLSSHNDREKPEVAAPGTNIYSTSTSSPWVGYNGSGTSFSAPVVAGMTSLLYHRNSSLKAWPESTKAVIMATAWKNKEGATRLSDKDGAGGVWAFEADYVARNSTIFGRWGGSSYSCSTAQNFDIATMYLYASYKTRVVIVWDQNPSYSYYSSKPSADLDLKIYNPSGTYVAGSSTWDNTYEIVEFTPTVTGTYKIRVYRYRCDLTPAWVGWAWSQP